METCILWHTCFHKSENVQYFGWLMDRLYASSLLLPLSAQSSQMHDSGSFTGQLSQWFDAGAVIRITSNKQCSGGREREGGKMHLRQNCQLIQKTRHHRGRK